SQLSLLQAENRSKPLIIFIALLCTFSGSTISILRWGDQNGTQYSRYLCVKILREDKNCPGSTQLVKWYVDSFPHCTGTSTVTEFYQFKFRYTNNGPLMDFASKNKMHDSNISCADTKKAGILLIRKIYVLMQNLGPLPNDVCLTMKLFYYDEVTPPEYQPPGFKEGDCEGMVFEGEPMYLNVGEVPTPFHMLKVKVITERERMENVDKTVLKPGELKAIRLDEDYPEGQDQKMNEDFLTDNKMEGQENTNQTLQVEGRKCVSTGRTDAYFLFQVEQLVNKTSELDVSEGKTRSGKRFQSNTHPVTQSISFWQVYHFEFCSSQDSMPKRRKFSEPKERF
uniref:HORMA domain-containing protein 1 n=1 Tax=Sphenodon punctatus TaxID=8508 RepID=A0A8D0GB81_SPHPU